MGGGFPAALMMNLMNPRMMGGGKPKNKTFVNPKLVEVKAEETVKKEEVETSGQ